MEQDDGAVPPGQDTVETGEQALEGAVPGAVEEQLARSERRLLTLIAIFLGAAALTGGVPYAASAIGPNEIQTGIVERHYSASGGTSSSGRCGIIVEIASGEKGQVKGQRLCDTFDPGDEVSTLVSKWTGDVVGVRFAGSDLGRARTPLPVLYPIAGLVALVYFWRRLLAEHLVPIAKGSAVMVAGAVAGMLVYVLLL